MTTRRSRVALVAVVLAGIALIAVVVGLIRQPTGLARLEAMPEATLAYPGSIRTIGPTGYDTDDYADAALWSRLGTDASEEDVIDWFAQRLAEMGWDRGSGTSLLGSVAEGQVCGWHNGATTARLSFWNMDALRERNPDFPPLATGYDFRLIDTAPTRIVGNCRLPR